MLSAEERKTLYDPKKFDGVSQQTRTDIINTINYDIEGWEEEEGKKFTHEELCKGLHYLLTTSKDLQGYIEQNKSQTSSSDPFIISSRGLDRLGDVSCCFFACDGIGDSEALAFGCIFLCAVAAIFWVCWLIYDNICDMLKSEEPTVVKMAKIISSLIVFIGVMVPLLLFMPSIPGIYGLSSVLAFFCGAVAAALFSYANKKILCFPNKQENLNELPKPSKELLKDLEVIEKMLSYARKGDNKEACMEFAKTVVRLHIKSMSKPEHVKNSSPVKGHGSFFPEQSANDTHQNVADSPTYSASK